MNVKRDLCIYIHVTEKHGMRMCLAHMNIYVKRDLCIYIRVTEKHRMRMCFAHDHVCKQCASNVLLSHVTAALNVIISHTMCFSFTQCASLPHNSST